MKFHESIPGTWGIKRCVPCWIETAGWAQGCGQHKLIWEPTNSMCSVGLVGCMMLWIYLHQQHLWHFWILLIISICEMLIDVDSNDSPTATKKWPKSCRSDPGREVLAVQKISSDPGIPFINGHIYSNNTWLVLGSSTHRWWRHHRWGDDGGRPIWIHLNPSHNPTSSSTTPGETFHLREGFHWSATAVLL